MDNNFAGYLQEAFTYGNSKGKCVNCDTYLEFGGMHYCQYPSPIWRDPILYYPEVKMEDKSSRAIKIVKVLMEKEIVKRDMNASELLNLLEILIQQI